MHKLIDPVCGMEVGQDALRAEGYDDVAFCCPACRKRFLDDPTAYSTAAGDGGGCCGGGGHGHRSDAVERPQETATVTSDTGGGCCGGHGSH